MSDQDLTAADADDTFRVNLEDRVLLLRLARQALNDYLDCGALLAWAGDAPALLAPRAAFVTLRRRRDGKLRGCRGECSAQRPLVESVIGMAIAAATDDSRFDPVTLQELPELEISISALAPVRPIRIDEIVVGRHGLWIVHGLHSGLLLPEVPLHFGWDRDGFLRGLCMKAGLPEDVWEQGDYELYGFETECWGEEESSP